MTGKRQQPRGGKPNPLVDRYTYITSIKAGNRTLAWLAIDRKSKRVVVAAPVGKARLLSLKQVRGLAPGHLAPIVRLLRTPDPSQLPADLGSTRPVGIAIADYVPGDTLHARLKFGRIPPMEAVNLCAHVVRAVRAMHEAGTPHGAISPRAVVTNPKGKWSAPVVTQLIAPTSGAFSSRERLQKRGPSFEDDSWAAHATLHAALTAEGPFAGKTREELLQNMFGSKPRRLDEFGVNEPELQKIIDAGLVTNPRYRASLDKLEQSLEQWLEKKGKEIQSLPPASSGEPMFPKDDAAAIMVSEAPPPEEVSTAVPLPRPHGKSLVGIVIDEPIDADAPAFAPPQRPEDLLDAVDDDDQPEAVPQTTAPAQLTQQAQEEEEDATRIYIPTGKRRSESSPGSAVGPGPPPATTPETPRNVDAVADAAAPNRVPPNPPPDAGATRPPRKGASKPRGAGVAGGGQALAIALALAVVALVTIFVRLRSNDGDPQPASSASSNASSALTSESQTAECVASFFPAGSIDSSKNFDFLCRAVDLRSTAKQMKKRLAGGAEGREASAAKDWEGLGWFELPLAATMRHACCSKAMAERILLPQPPAACESLSAVLKKMTAPPFSAENVGNRSGDFERAVECLTQEKQASAYGYDAGVDAENKRKFQSFLNRQANAGGTEQLHP